MRLLVPTRLCLPLLALAVWILPGFDSEGPSDPGSFGITVEGAETASFSGAPAAFTFATGSGLSETAYSFQLRAPRAGQLVSVTALPADGRTLAAGAYSFGLFESEAGPLTLGIVNVGSGSFASRSGTLTVTRPASERVPGVFAFEAKSESSTETVTVRGRFEADIGGATRR